MHNKVKELKHSKNETDRRECIVLLQAQLTNNPDDVEAWYNKACCHDFLGEEKEAEPCYRHCFNVGWQKLPEPEQKSFFVGFGSTLRNNLKYAESISVLSEAVRIFPHYPALKAFLALAYYSSRNDKLAAETLFSACLDAAEKGFDGYERAIQWYVEHLHDHPEPREDL
ncbi:MAG: tetratricopeptide repeat protein [Proteobacteria bacterium]|nr:tetratricopeptide repeat protein [Pseudomonadota bacterium]